MLGLLLSSADMKACHKSGDLGDQIAESCKCQKGLFAATESQYVNKVRILKNKIALTSLILNNARLTFIARETYYAVRYMQLSVDLNRL